MKVEITDDQIIYIVKRFIQDLGCEFYSFTCGRKVINHASLVNIIIYDDYVLFNDVDGKRHAIEFVNPRLFEILECVFAGNRLEI